VQLEEGYLKVKPFRYPKAPERSKSSSRPVSLKPGDDAKSLGFLATPSVTKSGDVTPKASLENLKVVEKDAAEETGKDTRDAPTSAPHTPQTHRLFGSHMNSIVTYENDKIAWIASDGIMSRVSSTVYQRFAGGGYLGGVKCVRGYKDPGKSSDTKLERPSTPNSTAPDGSGNPGLQLDERQQRLLKRRSAPPGSTAAAPLSIDDLRAGPISKLPESSDTTLKRQISSITDGLDAEAGEEAIRKRDEKEIQDDYQDHEGDDQSRDIDHLILVTHGVGAKLGLRTERVNVSTVSCVHMV
jgi:hypothetical protein